MPPLAAAAEILASPVAYTRMPQASARPTFGAVAAGPAETGPFMLMVIGAMTGPWPMAAHPLRSAAHVTASIEPFSMGGPPYTVPSPVRPDSGDSKVPAPCSHLTRPLGYHGPRGDEAACACRSKTSPS